MPAAHTLLVFSLVALFFLALFPRFLHDGAGAAATRVLVLGARLRDGRSR
jgi:threonine/homoserine/homoserine lactone efflux protein